MSAERVGDVLIIGAGPTGLSLAISLHGIAVRIIDRAQQPSSVSKALAVWSASLEALQGMQVVDAFLRQGKRLKALCIGDGKRQLARMEVGDGIDSPFPFPLLLPQSETERLLGAQLAALGVTVERGVELTDLAQDDGGVTANLSHVGGGSETARARYLVGCDGARSAVRQALGIAFEGYTEPQTFLLGDVIIDGGSLDHDNIYLWWGRGGTVALFPFERETWRIFAMRTGDANGDTALTLDELQDHADRHGPPGLRLRDPSWLSAFRINERVVARLSDGTLLPCRRRRAHPQPGPERSASRFTEIARAKARSMRFGMAMLATIGATSPFVGLFGTVWGIMNSFIGISKAQTTNLAVVAPGIAEALLATAIGLVAAIPAVIIYNHFSRATKAYLEYVGRGSGAVGRLLSRDLDRSRDRLLARAAE